MSKRNNDRQTKPVSAIKLVRTEVNEHGDHWLLLKISASGRTTEVRIQPAELSKIGIFRERMQNLGVSPNTDFQAEADRLKASNKPVINVTFRAGFYGDRFVCRYGEFGEPEIGDIPTEFDRQWEWWRPIQRSGTRQAYLRGIRNALLHSSILVNALCSALTPALLARLGKNISAVQILTGPSSTGKTTVGRLILSVSGSARKQDFVSSNMTSGVAGDFSGFSCTAVPFSDLKAQQSKGRALPGLLQTLTFGLTESMTRMRKGQAPLLPPENCLAVFAAEESLVDLFQSRGVNFQKGEAARINEITVNTRENGGIFDCDPETSAILIKELEDTLDESHGHLLPWFIEYMNRYDLESYRSYIEGLRSDFWEVIGPVPDIPKRSLEFMSYSYALGRDVFEKWLGCELVDESFRKVARKVVDAISNQDADQSYDIDSAVRFLCDDEEFPRVLDGVPADRAQHPNGFMRGKRDALDVFAFKDCVDRVIKRSSKSAVYSELERRGALIRVAGEIAAPVRQAGFPRARMIKFDLAALQRIRQDQSK